MQSADEHLAKQIADKWVSRFSMLCRRPGAGPQGRALDFKIFKAAKALETAATSKAAVVVAVAA